MKYLQVAKGRRIYLAWAGFSAAAILYFVVAGFLGFYLTDRFGPIAGIIAFNVLAMTAIPLFRAGMARARKRRDVRDSPEAGP